MKRKQASHSVAPQHPDSHYQHLKNAIPDWLGQASPARHQALKSAQPLLTDRLPNLTSLGMRGYQLDDIPQAVFKMNSLTALSLPECRITLSRNSRDALAGMSNLDTLDLSGNPLRRTPELRNLQQLSMLNLSNTGIRDVPKGLFDIPNLTQVDLSGNAITEMPSELMEANPDLTMDYDFSGNPFTAQSLQRIAAYFHETGNTLGIDAVAGMPRPGNLPPDVEMES